MRILPAILSAGALAAEAPEDAWTEITDAYNALYDALLATYSDMNIPEVKKANRLRDFFNKVSYLPGRVEDSCTDFADATMTFSEAIAYCLGIGMELATFPDRSLNPNDWATMEAALMVGLDPSDQTWYRAWRNHVYNNGNCGMFAFRADIGFYGNDDYPCNNQYLAFCSAGEFATTTWYQTTMSTPFWFGR
ncbi:Oidioi.mRNA.OKI2018_I69.PAR.g8473.t1.cds [Oikopleura dioica]|uniref:Oidioi.mRNA.OKI2018_I69.PAR.g8473.t1.cds n=1 Tax=Oikopleura dioica TaxID=34765 RepID=A0ABN7RG42_OIKDI|nr:Oidioi.mRNA.OKI2018_I69.PAR.g8473.t1.cds [Oikopleura dioica]